MCARRSSSKSRFLPTTSNTLRFTPRSTTNQEIAGRPVSTGTGGAVLFQHRGRHLPHPRYRSPPQERTGRAARHLCAGRNRERDRCRGGRPSQGNRLVKHAVPNERVESTFFSDIHSTAQFLFQIEKQPTREPRRRTRTGLNQ